MFLSILAFTYHKLFIADGLTLVPLIFRGWEAFPTPGASLILVSLGPFHQRCYKSPLYPWYFRHSLWRALRQMRVCAIQMVVDFTTSKENFGSIVGFWNHSHLARNLPLKTKNYKKNFSQKFVYIQKILRTSSSGHLWETTIYYLLTS